MNTPFWSMLTQMFPVKSSVRSITRELYSGQLRVVEIKGMPMLRDFSFAQPQGQESGLAQVFMQFAMHNNHKL